MWYPSQTAWCIWIASGSSRLQSRSKNLPMVKIGSRNLPSSNTLMVKFVNSTQGTMEIWRSWQRGLLGCVTGGGTVLLYIVLIYWRSKRRYERCHSACWARWGSESTNWDAGSSHKGAKLPNFFGLQAHRWCCASAWYKNCDNSSSWKDQRQWYIVLHLIV